MKTLEEQFEQSEAGESFRCLLLEIDSKIQEDVKQKTLEFIQSYTEQARKEGYEEGRKAKGSSWREGYERGRQEVMSIIEE
jgi:hypothetical protein